MIETQGSEYVAKYLKHFTEVNHNEIALTLIQKSK
jgi:hypothetical protein